MAIFWQRSRNGTSAIQVGKQAGSCTLSAATL
jgi:hypothetical protein